jgi:PAS domain S-box-containing protein
MLEKDPAVVRRMLSSHNIMDGVKAAVLRNDGSLFYGDIDYRIPPDLITSPRESSLELPDALVFLRPLVNQKECHQCHSPRDRVRGIVAIKISTEKVKREVATTAKHMAIFGFLTALISGSSLILVLRKMVLNPLTSLKAGAEKIRDGNLSHRIDMERKDELGALATSFNQMAGKIESAQKGLEDAVHKKTKELRVIAELSTNVFRGDLGVKSIISGFLAPITEELGYSCCALFLLDKETGALHPEYTKGLAEGFFMRDISITGDHPFGSIVLEGRSVVRKSEDLGIAMVPGTLAMIPLTSHRKKRCRDTNQCPHLDCPAYDHRDERCWLIRDTLCRSPHSVRDKHKIYGCLHCETFPITGILIAGSEGPIGKSSLHSLEILASEVESAIENYRLIDDKRQDILNLIRLHDTSVESLKSLQLVELTKSIVSVAASFANADASLLWLVKDSGTLQLQSASIADTGPVPSAISVKDIFAGRALVENRPIETISMAEVVCLKDLIETHGFLYAASVPLKVKHAPIGCLTLFKKNDFFMTDSEKAIITLFAGQAASAIVTSKIHGELKDQKEFSDAMFNSAVSGVMVLDKEGVILRINQAGSDIFQLIPRQVNVCRITDLYPETGEMLRLTGKNTGKEVAITLKDGRTRPIGFSNSPLLDKNWEEKGIIVVFQDLTEIKELQAELRKKQHFESMGKIISGVAHEVRNPLFAIQSITQILERELESDSQQDLIRALLKETYRMKNLVDELLLYSRPSRLNVSDVDFATLLPEIKQYARAKDRDVHVITSVAAPSALRADRDKLVQVFLNLVNNSLGAGAGNIRIAVEEGVRGVTVSFSDDGIGIRKEDMGKIFDPFFTTKREGTGLGLPICRKIIEDHGGTLDILSEEGKGTTATVFFAGKNR